MQTAQWLEDEIYPVGGTVTWAADNRTVLYTTIDEEGRPYAVARHMLSENKVDGLDDEIVYGKTKINFYFLIFITHKVEKDPRFSLEIGSSKNNKYFLLVSTSNTASEVLYLLKQSPKSEFSSVSTTKTTPLFFKKVKTRR